MTHEEVYGATLQNEKPRLAGPFSMERTGIEPVPSGLQIPSHAGVGWSREVVSAPPSHEPLLDWVAVVHGASL
jgi:hypothetical protein